jgi:hypothetical protein
MHTPTGWYVVAMDKDQLPDDEAARRRDEVVKRMLATPPQPRPKPDPESKRGRPKKGAA